MSGSQRKRHVAALTRLVFVLGAMGCLVGVFGACAAPAPAGVANAGVGRASAANPLVGLRWGNFVSRYDEVFPSYWGSSGEQRRLLGRIAWRPRPRWFGAWYSDADAESAARDYIAVVTDGRPDVLVQMVVFRLDPWEQPPCAAPPDAAKQASYRRWTDGFAAGIGSARVALVLQPDLPEALCGRGYSKVPVSLVAYSARAFGSLPHTSVYIDAGAADWEKVGQAVALLRGAGIRYARGFALNDTHYDSTAREIVFGQRIVRALAAAGYPGRHFVINTAENGRPFTHGQFPGNFQEPPVCATPRSRRCATLGIPPTANVAGARWQLPRRARAIASRLVDAYLWVGRPWLYSGSYPFELQRALALARTTPF